jgi:TPR repeat protein
MNRIIATLLLITLAVPAWSQDPDRGLQAYERGDFAAALQEWRPLAEKGDAVAQCNVGLMFNSGEGVLRDFVEAARWFRLSAGQGYMDCQNVLGTMYYWGEGVPQDFAEATRWFRAAAEQGHAPAQFSIGRAYVTGEGVRQDYSEAVRWFHMAADQGDSSAQSGLGVMYFNGTGVQKDYSMAMRLFRLAAAQGDANAQYNIGDSYLTGEGVSKNNSEAVRWFRMASDQGDDDAQVSLGTMYADGLGVEQNYDEAIRLYLLAAEQGNAVAKYHLDNMDERRASLSQQTEQEQVLVVRVQEALVAIGYYDGSIDGIAGPVTRAAVAAFQQDIGVPITGEVSKELVGQLELALAVVARELAEPTEQVSESSEFPELQTPTETAEQVGTGTGFFIDNEGLILTNKHVVLGCETVKVTHSGRTVTSDFIQPDKLQDLALIETDIRPRAVAIFRSGRGIRPGDSVYVYGFPLQGILASDAGITAGNVSNLAGIGDDRSLMQITAPIQPGNSGGPLLDETGNVVGIVVGKLDSLVIATLTGDIPQNVNFAINATEARKFLDSYGIDYRTAPSDKKIEAADIAASARHFTVLVECWR